MPENRNPPVNPASKARPAPNPKGDAGKTVLARGQLRYKSDGRGMMFNIVMIQSGLVALVVGFLLYFTFFAPPSVRYFAATSTGQVIPMVALDRPVDTDPVVLGWVSNAASDVMTFNFKDYNARLGQAQSYFTPRGWQSFILGLRKANYITTVVANLQAQSAVPKEAPRIIDRCSGTCAPYYWVVQMPLLISVESLDKKSNADRLLTLRIVRVPPTENAAGIQIDDWKEQ